MNPPLLDGIHFMHLRHFNEKGQVLGHGGMTLAWEVTSHDDGLFRIRIGKAICSPKDNFWRKRGRELATNRLVLPTSAVRIGDSQVDVHGEITTRYTLKEDIHEALENWAYGAL